MICHCGSALRDDSDYCPWCGCEMEPLEWWERVMWLRNCPKRGQLAPDGLVHLPNEAT